MDPSNLSGDPRVLGRRATRYLCSHRWANRFTLCINACSRDITSSLFHPHPPNSTMMATSHAISGSSATPKINEPDFPDRWFFPALKERPELEIILGKWGRRRTVQGLRAHTSEVAALPRGAFPSTMAVRRPKMSRRRIFDSRSSYVE